MEPLIIAHRGYHKDMPENSIRSIQTARDIGADMVELDVRCTSDGHPVVFHDHSLYRTTAQRGIVEMLTLKQVQKLDIGVRFDEKHKGTRVPTLDEVLAYSKNRILLNIEIKTPGFEEKILKLIYKHKMQKRVLISSLRQTSLRAVRKLDSDIAIGCVSFFISDFKELMETVSPYSVHMWAPLLLSKIPIDTAHNEGLRVIAWPVKNLTSYRILNAFGVDGVITNIPDQILEAAGEREGGKRKRSLPPPLEPPAKSDS